MKQVDEPIVLNLPPYRATELPTDPLEQSCQGTTPCHITVVNNQGGKVTIEQLLDIMIPVGESNDSWSFTARMLDEQDVARLPHLANKKRITSVFELFGADDNGSMPDSLTLSFAIGVAGDSFPAVYYYDEQTGRWIKLGGIVSAAGDQIEVEVEVNLFSKFAVFANERELTDISQHWAQAIISEAMDSGFVNGYPDGTFRPDKQISREEFIHLLVQALRLPESTATLTFADTASIGGWANKSIAAAVEHRLINGYADGSFQPKENISRAEMTAIVVRALGLTTDHMPPSNFVDDAAIPAWAKGFVAAAASNKLVEGRSGNKFEPNETATRAEAVAMIWRSVHFNE